MLLLDNGVENKDFSQANNFDSISGLFCLKKEVGSESPCRAELPSADLYSLFFQIHPR